LENRTRHISPYPWGFSSIKIDDDLAQRNKFGLRSASGVFQDGTPFDMFESPSGSRYTRDLETVVDAASNMHVEQEIEVAHLRVGFDVRKTPKPGFHCLKVAKILEVRDKAVILDRTFAPPVLVTHGHAVVAGWVDRVIGWVDTKLETLSRYASDASSGGGLQQGDYF